MFSEGVSPSHQNLLIDSLVLQTRDADEAASLLSMSAVPYRSELLTSACAFSTEIFVAESPRMQLSRVRTSGAMRVRARLPEDSYAVVFAVAGDLEHRVDGDLVRVRPGSGLVQSPSQAVEVHTPERFELLFLRLSRENLIDELEKVLLRKINTPLVFSPHFKLATEAGQRFRGLVLSLFTRLGRNSEGKPEEPGGAPEDKACLAARALENELVTLLLEGQRHNYTRLLARHSDAGPWQIRAAEEYMRANAQLPLTLGDLSLAAGVGSRTLQHSFKHKRGYSPMQFLRRLRLDGVFEELSRPDRGTTVTRAASRWGFLHFGRFAAEYQARFGERPSDTLQRGRTRS